MAFDTADLPSEMFNFPEDPNNVVVIPDWYKKMLQNKIEAAKDRLEKLSNFVCTASYSASKHIRKIEKNNYSLFCKMDYYPHHPPMNKIWVDYWSLYGSLECKRNNSHDIDDSHTADCLVMKVKHTDIVVPTTISDVSKHDYSQDVIDSVKLLKDFVLEFLEGDASKAYYVWPKIDLFIRSNSLNEFIIVIIVQISCLIPHLQKFFQSGRGQKTKAKSVFCFDDNWSKEMKQEGALLIFGTVEMQHRVGSLSIHYDSKNCVLTFNSVEFLQLEKIIQDYLGLTKETTVLECGCNFGILSLMMANKCKQVIGLNFPSTKDTQLVVAERLKKANYIQNVTFIASHPKDILDNCLPLIENRHTVAVVSTKAPYCRKNKGKYVITCLRNMPSVSKVLIHGTLTKECYKNISLLTSRNFILGKPFLPTEGCILDKSPSKTSQFNIIILFERKTDTAPRKTLLPLPSSMNQFDNLSVAPESSVSHSQTTTSNEVAFNCPPPPLPPTNVIPFSYPFPPTGSFCSQPNSSYPSASSNQQFQYNLSASPLSTYPSPYNFYSSPVSENSLPPPDVSKTRVQARVSIFSMTESESPKKDVEIDRESRKKLRLS